MEKYVAVVVTGCLLFWQSLVTARRSVRKFSHPAGGEEGEAPLRLNFSPQTQQPRPGRTKLRLPGNNRPSAADRSRSSAGLPGELTTSVAATRLRWRGNRKVSAACCRVRWLCGGGGSFAGELWLERPPRRLGRLYPVRNYIIRVA